MKKVKYLAVFAMVAIILAACVPSTEAEDKPELPEGAVYVLGVVILPGELENAKEMGLAFMGALPADILEAYFEFEEEYFEEIFESYVMRSGVILHIAGVREIKSIEIIETINGLRSFSRLVVTDVSQERYYVGVSEVYINLVALGERDGEILFHNMHVCGLGWAMERQEQRRLLETTATITGAAVVVLGSAVAAFVVWRHNKREELAEKAK